MPAGGRRLFVLCEDLCKHWLLAEVGGDGGAWVGNFFCPQTSSLTDIIDIMINIKGCLTKLRRVQMLVKPSGCIHEGV